MFPDFVVAFDFPCFGKSCFVEQDGEDGGASCVDSALYQGSYDED